MVFSEDSRVKIPCILHLMRLGYDYLSLKNATWDEETNIFPDLFTNAIAKINVLKIKPSGLPRWVLGTDGIFRFPPYCSNGSHPG